MEKYIHYGHKKFDSRSFNSVRNTNYGKPTGGLWLSPESGRYTWKSLVEVEFNPKSYLKKVVDENIFFECEIKDTSNIYKIETISDLEKLPRIDGHDIFFDFEKMVSELGIDGLCIDVSKDPELRSGLYFWDCNCLFIMNPDVVSPIEKIDVC